MGRLHPGIQLWACGGTGREGGRLTSLAVTEFTARHGKIPTKLRSPPLLQADAEFWHPPGWQPLGRTALVAVPAPEGRGCAHPRPQRGTQRLQVQPPSRP